MASSATVGVERQEVEVEQVEKRFFDMLDADVKELTTGAASSIDQGEPERTTPASRVPLLASTVVSQTAASSSSSPPRGPGPPDYYHYVEVDKQKQKQEAVAEQGGVLEPTTTVPLRALLRTAEITGAAFQPARERGSTRSSNLSVGGAGDTEDVDILHAATPTFVGGSTYFSVGAPSRPQASVSARARLLKEQARAAVALVPRGVQGQEEVPNDNVERSIAEGLPRGAHDPPAFRFRVTASKEFGNPSHHAYNQIVVPEQEFESTTCSSSKATATVHGDHGSNPGAAASSATAAAAGYHHLQGRSTASTSSSLFRRLAEERGYLGGGAFTTRSAWEDSVGCGRTLVSPSKSYGRKSPFLGRVREALREQKTMEAPTKNVDEFWRTNSLASSITGLSGSLGADSLGRGATAAALATSTSSRTSNRLQWSLRRSSSSPKKLHFSNLDTDRYLSNMYAVGGAAGGGPRGATLREGADGDILGGPAEYRSANQFLPPSRVAGPSGYADYREGGRIVSTLRAEQPQFGAAKARGGTPVGPSSAAGGAGAILDDGGMEFEVERFLSLSSRNSSIASSSRTHARHAADHHVSRLALPQRSGDSVRARVAFTETAAAGGSAVRTGENQSRRSATATATSSSSAWAGAYGAYPAFQHIPHHSQSSYSTPLEEQLSAHPRTPSEYNFSHHHQPHSHNFRRDDHYRNDHNDFYDERAAPGAGPEEEDDSFLQSKQQPASPRWWEREFRPRSRPGSRPASRPPSRPPSRCPTPHSTTSRSHLSYAGSTPGGTLGRKRSSLLLCNTPGDSWAQGPQLTARTSLSKLSATSSRRTSSKRTPMVAPPVLDGKPLHAFHSPAPPGTWGPRKLVKLDTHIYPSQRITKHKDHVFDQVTTAHFKVPLNPRSFQQHSKAMQKFLQQSKSEGLRR